MNGNGNEAVRINVLISRKVYDDLKDVADRYKMSLSEIIRQRLIEFLMDLKKFEETPERRE